MIVIARRSQIKYSDEELRARRRESNREYCAANKEKLSEKNREYYAANKEKLSEKGREYRAANKEKLSEKNRKYYAANKEKRIKYRRKYKAAKRQTDPAYKLACYLRRRLNHSLRGKFKTGSAVRDMGCTGQQACEHLESLFDEHMTWDNWGTYWQVDHIYPMAAADLEDRVQLLAVCNYRNLQPLEKGENNRKGDTVTPEGQALFDELVGRLTCKVK